MRLRLRSALLARRLPRARRGVLRHARVTPGPVASDEVAARALAAGINLRRYDDGDLGIALDETVGSADLADLAQAFGAAPARLDDAVDETIPAELSRLTTFLEHPVFHAHRSETEMLRYIKRLESRDLSLTTSMIPLGSCTMKLNAARR
jgi:glycine dehydrogenase